jgi:CheY-like chemotaxis protein
MPAPILVVDNDRDDVELLKAAFERCDLTRPVDFVGDGQQALDYLMRVGEFAGRGTADPVFVLTDIRLPRVTGHELLETMRADDSLRHIPVIMLTSSEHQVDIERAYANGANAYLVKPQTFDDLKRNVASVVAVWSRMNRVPTTGATAACDAVMDQTALPKAA